jgi:hypothetical protein
VGATRGEVLASYPPLGADHISAALAYAAELAHEERLVPIRAMGSSSLTRMARTDYPYGPSSEAPAHWVRDI